MSTSPNDCGCGSLVSEGGISGSHPTVETNAAHVGPTTDTEFNTVRAGLVPVACWRVEDIRFEFDSSFVTPGIEVELGHLLQLAKDHPPSSKSEGKPGCPLSVFGHADPVGNDDYNKQLSGRRATAIYALLTRDTHLWEKLFSQPFGNDKWGRKSLETMLDNVSPAPEGKSNREQAIQHEHNAGKRKALYEQYMEKLCGPELKFKKEDFLGHGDDAGGKGDFQGCSEFNPVLIFSQEDQNKFDQDKGNTERNTANAPNRRVMVLIFRKGSRVDPSKWPCPRANEGIAGCKKRFFSDGEKRRSSRLPNKPRKFEETNDTFACRFYDRLSVNSPCERILVRFSFRLYDLERRFIPLAPFELSVEGRPPIKGLADAEGFAVVPDVEVPTQIFIRWGFPLEADEEPKLVFEGEMFIKPEEDDQDTEAKQKLQNLGYPQESPLEENVAAFQRDYGQLASPALRETGKLDDATMSLLRDVYASSENDLQRDIPQRKAES